MHSYGGLLVSLRPSQRLLRWNDRPKTLHLLIEMMHDQAQLHAVESVPFWLPKPHFLRPP